MKRFQLKKRMMGCWFICDTKTGETHPFYSRKSEAISKAKKWNDDLAAKGDKP